ncbi:MAG TPA: class I SAM-dependent methyltransferase [Pyrinomonadaceae bacterium]|nr:class I SAM-dependent methyltransferase [Pyrinomonadaceae bacterium]
MKPYTAETYGEHVAAVYDEWYQDYDAAAITALAELAGDGRALELGIGTGRIALPLAARGVKVYGVDVAPSMVARLRAKPAGDNIEVFVGDFADLEVPGKFALIYIVFNTFFNLLTQEAQVRCFRNVARHLAPGGGFLIEAFVPDMKRFDGDQTNRATKVTTEHIEMDVCRHEPAEQRVVSQKVIITDGHVRLYPIQIRYAWPSELDLMAQLAGLRLRERWENWQGARFTSQSGKHISLYESAN